MGEQFSIISEFVWTPERDQAAKLLSQGYSIKEVAEEVGVTDRTIYNWKNIEEFEMEVDRLSVVYGLASKAERTRLLMKMARQKVKEDGTLELDDTSLMDIIKEMRMQTDGIRLNVAQFYTALVEEARSVARGGQVRDVPALDDESDVPD